MKRLIYLLPVAALIVNSCKKEGCNQPFAFNYDPAGTSEKNCVYEPLALTIDFKMVYGEDEVQLGEDFTTEEGRSITVDYYGMYFTEMSLVDNGDTVMLDDDAFLFKGDNQTYTASYVPAGDLTAFSFNLGVNQERNDTLDPTTITEGIFSPQVPTMYWSWATGYRFISINGLVDTTEAMTATSRTGFEYHTGLNQLLRKVNLEASPVRDGNKINYTIVLDLKTVLEGVDFTNELDIQTHTSDNYDLAELITENTVNAFSIQ